MINLTLNTYLATSDKFSYVILSQSVKIIFHKLLKSMLVNSQICVIFPHILLVLISGFNSILFREHTLYDFIYMNI